MPRPQEVPRLKGGRVPPLELSGHPAGAGPGGDPRSAAADVRLIREQRFQNQPKGGYCREHVGVDQHQQLAAGLAHGGVESSYLAGLRDGDRPDLAVQDERRRRCSRHDRDRQ
jgi:hypothetical protein